LGTDRNKGKNGSNGNCCCAAMKNKSTNVNKAERQMKKQRKAVDKIMKNAETRDKLRMKAGK